VIAVLAIDLQNGIFARAESRVRDAEGVLRRSQAVIAAAATIDLPVVVVQDDAGPDIWQPETEDWQVHSEIAPPPDAIRIRKKFGDAFRGTTLEDELQSRGVTELVILGAMSDFSIRATLQRALLKRYAVTLVTDAHSTLGIFDAPAVEHIETLNDEVEGAQLAGLPVEGIAADEVARRLGQSPRHP
jgi:nicotinamidase-related amidase